MDNLVNFSYLKFFILFQVFQCVVLQNTNVNRINQLNRNNDRLDHLGGRGNVNSNLVEQSKEDEIINCPTNWVTQGDSCYKFVRSPKKTRDQARRQCQVEIILWFIISIQIY